MAILMLAILVAGALIAGYSDLRTRRIPNALTGVLGLAAIALNIPGGWTSVATAALVMLVAFAAGTLAFSLGWFGGGDVKLLAACCGFAGYPGAVELVLYTFAAGGLVVLVDAAGRKQFRSLLSGVYQTALGLGPTSRSGVPYAVAIAAGACTYALSTLPAFRFLRLPL